MNALQVSGIYSIEPADIGALADAWTVLRFSIEGQFFLLER